jgi:nuclear pore complex protein Nup62
MSGASSRLRHLNVEDLVSLWSRELEEHVHSFVAQAVQVASWDASMLDNFKKIVQLQNQVRNVQTAQTQLHALLATIQAHQAEFHSLLDNLEAGVDSLPSSRAAGANHQQMMAPEEMRREEAFQLAEQIDRTSHAPNAAVF